MDARRSFQGVDQTRYFFELTPDRVLDAAESAGFRCTGRALALNSFEHRVYDVEIEDAVDVPEASPGFNLPQAALYAKRRVIKFYRPGRWSREQILEEHAFLRELLEAEIPAVAPLPFSGGSTLRKLEPAGIFYAVFPKVGGRAPDELSDEQLRRVGRLLGRIHNVGASRRAEHRVIIGPVSYGLSELEFLLQGNFIPIEFQSRYMQAAEEICRRVQPWFDGAPIHRIHGDCHLGNLLWNKEGPFFVDFDDMVRGPAVQDVWMLVPGRDHEALRQRTILLEGYREMRDFDVSGLKLIEPLRALRYIHYTAWVARRWSDPAFPLAFPEFGSHQYWQDETEDLEEQLRYVKNL